MCFLAWNVKISRPIWYNVIVQNMFVYILLHTFLKWPVFQSLTKTLYIKLTSEIGVHIKYALVIIVSIQLPCVQQLPVIVWLWTVKRLL
jgi:hypothetical protein